MKKLLDDTSTRIKAFYQEKKRYQPLVAFLAGFIWDSLTLTRIDLLIDNLVMFAYIVFAGVFIFLINMVEEKQLENKNLLKYSNWYPNIVQFFFGGLFSGYVVYYFKSASLSKSWLFLLFLLFLFIGNEFIKNRLNNLVFQFVFYYLATYSFFIFYLPVLFKTMGIFMFLLSGLVSSAFVGFLIYILYKNMPEKINERFKRLVLILGSIYLIFNLLYFTNIIPPVPLSLKDSGIFHSVRFNNGRYSARYEEGKWYEFFKDSDDTFRYAAGDTVFCFAAVFAPTDLNTGIRHHWQMYNENQDKWLTTDRLNYKISGGRDGGYRGYTFKKNVQPGLWRVDVETEREQLLGRISFEVIADSTHYPFEETDF